MRACQAIVLHCRRQSRKGAGRLGPEEQEMSKFIKGVGMAVILAALMLGATDAVSAQEDGYVYNQVFIDTRMDAVWHPGRPLWVAGEASTENRKERSVQRPVPLYSQLDNVGTEWTSCGPTSLAMALNYLERGPTAQEIIEYAVSHSGQDGAPLYEPHDPDRIFTSPHHLYEMAAFYGRPQAGWIADERGAEGKLRVLLNQDLPVIVDVTVSLSRSGSTSAHFVLVTGIGTDNTVTIHDPYVEGQGAQVRTVSWDEFYWAWQNNSDGNIGGHGWWMVVRSGWSPTEGSA